MRSPTRHPPGGGPGEDIPLAGRIVAVVDAYDCQIHRRPYRAPTEPARAIEELVRDAGRHFDPAVVEAFIALEASGRLGEALTRQVVAWPDATAEPGESDPTVA